MIDGNTDLVMRLGLATLLGGLIGLERETHNQPAGLRTHMVVAIGSALITILSIKIVEGIPGGDPGRIAAQIVSGIGFLGAGAILRFGLSIKGLTTAACLWTAAGIGMACGMWYWQGAVVATLLVLTATFLFDKIEKRFVVGRAIRRFVVAARDAAGLQGRLETLLVARGLKIRQVGIHRDLNGKKIQFNLMTDSPDGADLESLSREISSLPEVESIEID